MSNHYVEQLAYTFIEKGRKAKAGLQPSLGNLTALGMMFNAELIPTDVLKDIEHTFIEFPNYAEHNSAIVAAVAAILAERGDR